MLTGTQYVRRHDMIGRYVHWCTMKDKGVKVEESWMKHVPEKVVENNGTTIMWDSAIITDRKVKANRPDIIVHDTKNRTCLFIDISVPVCCNIVRKEAEKLTKYRDLEIETQKCWNLQKIRTIPIIIGALGTVCNGFEEYAKIISPRIKFKDVQKSALLSTARIIRNFLTPKEDLITLQ